ncbi:MAG: phage head morphogenesis protein [Lachnospiraceae bacterium]|nr:phage head morphogenesis protein [Lachnospiraceae bacterium]
MAIWMKPPHRVRKRKKSIEAQAVLDKLQAYLDGNAEVPVKMLCGFWKDQQDAITYREIREAVKAGMLDEAAFQEWARDYSVLVARKLEPVWERAMAAGAASQTLLSGTSFTFNTQAPGVVQWISQRGAAFVTACSEEQKKAISSLLAQKVVESHTVDELARLIRPCIGLTDGQSKATLRYYDNIAASLRENHPRMKSERIQQKATDAAAKYAERQHRQRAVTIAQTEMAFAYNRGADEGIRQAQAQNLIGAVEKRWSTSGDENVCSTCEALDGIQIGMEGGFGFARRELFEGQDLLPPAHPRCGCAVMYIEVEKPESIIETSESIVEYPSSHDVNFEEEIIVSNGDSGIIKEIRIPESAREIPGITDAVLDEIQKGIDVIRSEYVLKLDTILVEDMRDTHPNTPYCCKYIDVHVKHKAVFVINSGFDFSDIQYVVRAGYAQGYFAGKTVEDHIIHEMAHIMTGQECNTASEFLVFLSKVESKFVPGVSGYSDIVKDGFETIAEAFVKVRNDEFVPDEARRLVEEYVERWKK